MERGEQSRCQGGTICGWRRTTPVGGNDFPTLVWYYQTMENKRTLIMEFGVESLKTVNKDDLWSWSYLIEHIDPNSWSDTIICLNLGNPVQLCSLCGPFYKWGIEVNDLCQHIFWNDLMSTGVTGSKPTLMPVFLEETAPVVAKDSGNWPKKGEAH